MWVRHMMYSGANPAALSFDDGVVGHAALSSMRDGAYEVLVGFPADSGA